MSASQTDSPLAERVLACMMEAASSTPTDKV